MQEKHSSSSCEFDGGLKEKESLVIEKSPNATALQNNCIQKEELFKLLADELQCQSDIKRTSNLSLNELSSQVIRLPLYENEFVYRQATLNEENNEYLNLFTIKNPLVQSKEELYGFVDKGAAKLEDYNDFKGVLRSIECIADKQKTNLLIIHDFYEHPLILLQMCKVLSAHYNVFLPYLKDIFDFAKSIVYQSPEENVIGYLNAYCKDAIKERFVVVAHGAGCYLAENLINECIECRKGYYLNNFSKIKGAHVKAKEVLPQVEVKTDSEVSVVTEEEITLRTSKLCTSLDDNGSEIELAQERPKEIKYKYINNIRNNNSYESLELSDIMESNLNNLTFEATLFKDADIFIRSTIFDDLLLEYNKKIKEIENIKKKYVLPKFRALRHFYNNLPQFVFLCNKSYERKFELIPLSSDYVKFSEFYYHEAATCILRVNNDKKVVCLFSDHEAMDPVFIEGYDTFALVGCCHDVFGCCGQLLESIVI